MQESEKNKVSGIILAGGKGIRLGRNKGLAILKDRHLIEHVIDNLRGVCDEILISSNSEQCKKFGYPVIPDIIAGKGPMSGIHACLQASSSEENIVISVDTPFAGKEYFTFLLAQKGEGYIAAPKDEDGRYEPLCAYYNKRVAIEMEKFLNSGQYKMSDLFTRLPFTAISIPEKMLSTNPMLFHNVNTEADLLLAEKYLDSKND